MSRKTKRVNKMIRAIIILCAGILVLFLSGYYLIYYTNAPLPLYSSKNVSAWVKSEGKEILISRGGKWEKFIVSGVTMEDTRPGGRPHQENISYDMYMEWFAKIAEMNANTIQVQDTMGTEFYRAFYDYNVNNQDPLYLLQGVTLEKEVYDKMKDAFSGKMAKLLSQKAYRIIDIVHGSYRMGSSPYIWDISDWVLAYVVGTDWEQDLVLYTNNFVADKAGYKGKFISTWPTASAFDTVLAIVGDRIFAYETGRYGEQRLLGYGNWARTDPLFHDASWSMWLNENLSHVNMELITVQDTVQSGIFAAYHIEPNYPFFLSFDPVYTKYVDEEGRNNPYRGYLKALNDYHRLPIVVTGFGVPASRGISNIDEIRGFNQGNLAEEEQGEILQSLYEDIISAGSAGGSIISWTDSWDQTVWNSANFVDTNRSTYWSDAQTSTQAYGLLAFEPGEGRSISYVDGDVSEWDKAASVIDKEGYRLQMMYDEKYIYLRIQLIDYNPIEDTIVIPLDITPNSGTKEDKTNELSYDRDMDFVILVQGENSKILVQEYYNNLIALYGVEVGKKNPYIERPNKESGQFDLIKQFVRQSMYDENGDTREPVLKDTGVLRYGNSNPNAGDYNSLADFIFSGNNIEIRVPWSLLNFSDPSNMMIHDDYYKNYGVKFMQIGELYAALTIKKATGTVQIPSGRLELKGWGDSPAWHTRLKKSYYYVQDIFAKY